MNSLTNIEEVKNLLNLGKFLTMYRVNFNGYRLYVQKEPFAYYSGLTGALSNATFKGNPDAKRLTGWRNSMIDSFGEKNTSDYIGMTADFGSLLHAGLVTIKEKGKINWSEEQEKAYNYFVNSYREKLLEPDVKTIKKQCYEYQKHLASLLQFVYERVEEIYAIEVPCKWEELKIATPIDLFCSCRQTEKGAFKKTTINIKTSSQISGHQLEQASCEMMMWNETYDNKAEFTAIMRTKDWTESKAPTFDYKGLSLEEAIKLSEDAKKRLFLCLNSDSTYLPFPVNKTFVGETKAGQKPEIISKTLEQEWNETLTI